MSILVGVNHHMRIMLCTIPLHNSSIDSPYGRVPVGPFPLVSPFRHLSVARRFIAKRTGDYDFPFPFFVSES